jgi:uncharacterized protein YkwD
MRSARHHGRHRARCTSSTRTRHGRKPLVDSSDPGSKALSGYDARPTPPRGRSRPNRAARAKRAGKGTEAPTVVTLSPAPATEAAGTIASVLATPCQNTEIMPTADNLDAVRAATLCLVNQERARDDELPLRTSSLLEQVAQSHSEAMVSEDYFAHVAPDGETQLERVTSSGYIPNSRVGYAIGENIAWGTLSMATPSSIVAAWVGSPEHLANILNDRYRDSAIGVMAAVPASLAEGQPGAIYTQEFGVIDR